MKRRMRSRILFILIICLGMGLCHGEEKAQYVENGWNFVEGSMDVSGGIPDDAEGVLLGIKESGVLRVGTEPYFPPQEFIDPALSGQESYVGSDMKLARLIADRMGVELQIIPMDFTHVLDAVAEDECDLVISALAYTPERAAKVTLSKGYYYTDASASSALIIREMDAESITGIEALEGKNLAAQSGSLQEALLAQNVGNYAQFMRLDSVHAVYEAVERRRADAGIVDIESGLSYIRNNPESGLLLVEGAHFELEPQFEGDRIAAKKGETQLMYFVNGVIDEVLNSGEYQAWYDEAEAYANRLGL